MAQNFLWYDLETSGLNAREQRIMQFAGQRTDLDLQPIGEPFNVLIKLADDILPDPDAIMVTGITPQSTLQEGLTEVEFLKLFHEQIALKDTIFVGYNTIRFDDEFIRFLHYRNFYDAYEWEWQDGRSRWDLLDVVRMTRALRPEGIKWPVVDGKPTNRLELLTKLNGVSHDNAHDALADVVASIEVARLIKTKQPKLFAALLAVRGKQDVKKFLQAQPVFVYSSGKFSNDTEKTAVVQTVHLGEDREGALLYDLRHDPTEFATMSPEELMARWVYTKEPNAPTRLPVKTLKYNHCPAIAPIGILSVPEVQVRLHITPEIMERHRAILNKSPEFLKNLVKARNLLDEERAEQWSKATAEPESALYDGFVDASDKRLLGVVRAAKPDELSGLQNEITDPRYKDMLPRYKARNFSGELTDEERADWEKYRYHVLMEGGTESRLAKYMHRLAELSKTEQATDKQYLLEELQLYAESVLPVTDFE